MTTFADKFIPEYPPEESPGRITKERTMKVKIQFIDHRTERKSKILASFEYVQLTYETLRAKVEGKDEEREIAHFNSAQQEWEYDDQFWSDVCIF